jgi:molybdate transport system substrate-binding protein
MPQCSIFSPALPLDASTRQWQASRTSVVYARYRRKACYRRSNLCKRPNLMPVELQLMSGYAPKEAFAKLGPLFERETAVKCVFHYSVLSAIQARLAAGARPDIIIMSVGLIDGYVSQTIACGDARASLGIVRTAVAIKAGSTAPDLSSLDAFRKSLLRARSIAHPPANATPSGAHCGKLMETLGISNEMAKKTRYLPALEGGLKEIVSGRVEFGIYPKSEVVNVPGVEVVGLLPPGAAFDNYYGAAAVEGSRAPDEAAAFVQFLGSPSNRQIWADAGFDPPTS